LILLNKVLAIRIELTLIRISSSQPIAYFENHLASDSGKHFTSIMFLLIFIAVAINQLAFDEPFLSHLVYEIMMLFILFLIGALLRIL
jgi:hypothetical protein